MGEITEMIDLHSHILPGLDDGAEVLEESIEMCRISFRDGIRTIVATPHILPGIYENNRPTILAKVQELNNALVKRRMRNGKFGMVEEQSAIRNPELRSFPVLTSISHSISSSVMKMGK